MEGEETRHDEEAGPANPELLKEVDIPEVELPEAAVDEAVVNEEVVDEESVLADTNNLDNLDFGLDNINVFE